MKIVLVSPISSKVAKDSLTYFSSKKVSPGDIVSVEVRSKKYDALVVGVDEARDLKADLKKASFGFKKIQGVKGASPFYPEFFQSCQDAGRYFVGNLGQIIDYFLPSDFLLGYENLPKPKKRISGSSIFRVAPTINEAEKLFSKLLRSDLNNLFLIHGSLRKKVLLERYREILDAKESVTVVMTPSFLFIPRHDVGEIMIENEISGHWHTIKRPYFDLRVFSKYLAKNLGANLSYGPGLLSVETFFESRIIPKFSNTQGSTLSVRDMSNKENLYKKSFILSNDLNEMLKKEGRTFLFALRKGLATQVVCHDCRQVLKDGDAPLTLHQKGEERILKNAYTQKTLDTKVRCANCGSWNFDSLGIGTDTVVEEIKKYFPKRKIFQIDKDATSSDKKAKEEIGKFYKQENAVLVGTEMAIPHLTNFVDNSAIVSMDSLGHIPSYKISERMLHLAFTIKNVTKEKMLVQTREAENFVVKALEENDLKMFFEKDLEKRKTFGYPPFSAVIKLSRKDMKDTGAEIKNFIDENLSRWKPNIRRFRRGKIFETSVLLKIPKEDWNEERQDKELSNFLSSLGPDWQIRLNPENLF